MGTAAGKQGSKPGLDCGNVHGLQSPTRVGQRGQPEGVPRAHCLTWPLTHPPLGLPG